MKYRTVLMAAVVIAVYTGCTRYSYPPNQMQSAASVNADLVASHGAPKTLGNSHVDIIGMSCAGQDFVLKVRYDYDFKEPIYCGLQYQVVPRTAGDNPIFTNPNGVMDLNRDISAGDATLTIPGRLVTETGSTILVRLKLRSRTVLEHLSASELIHINELCK